MGLFTGLRLRFTVALLLPLALLLGAFLPYLAHERGLLLRDGLASRVNGLGGLAAEAASGALEAGDARRLQALVVRIAADPEVVFALVRDGRGGILARGVPQGFDDARIRRALTGDAISTFPLFSDARRLGELVVLADRSAIEVRVERYRRKLWLGAALLLLGLSGALLMLLQFGLLRPLRHLGEGVARLRRGEDGGPVPVLARDELGHLSQAFNAVAADLLRERRELRGARLSLEDELRRARVVERRMELAASAFAHAGAGIMITDARGIIVDVNQALCAATGYRANELVGRSPRLLRSGRHADGFYTAMWSGLTAHGRWSGEIWNRHKDGELIPFLLSISAVADERGGAGHYVALYSSIRAQKAQQRQLERVAHFDPLTELPNRVLLADRLQQVLRTTDTIARLGGDEFVAVLIDLEPEDDGSLMLGRLLECVARPLWLDGLELRVSASIGVSFYPQDEEVDAERLLRQADQAMYRSKLAGKNRFSVYEPGRDRALRGRIEDLGRVRQALDAGEFELFYQPKVNLRSGAVIGYEALLRWHHPEQGLLHPEEFLPLVEGSELDLELGEWVLGAVLAQLGAWSGSRLERPISLNLSAHQLRHAGFLEMLRRRLAQAPGVDPGRLGLEIVSAGGGGELTRVTRVMEACRSLGIALALDDFGAGYSSLSSLKQLPVGLIKVDRTFVSQMLDDSENLAIVEGVLALAAAFQRATLAEGVETVEHGRVLLQLGCELAQGYGIARPMPAEAIGGWLGHWRQPARWHGVQAVERERLPTLYAQIDHRSWARMLDQYVRGRRTAPPSVESRHCRVGRWLEDGPPQGSLDREALAGIRALHQEVHRLSVELLTLHTHDQQHEAVSRIGELQEMNERLCALLGSLTGGGEASAGG